VIDRRVLWLGSATYGGAPIEALHFEADADSFTLGDEAFAVFADLATEYVSRLYDEQWQHPIVMMAFGEHSIDVVTNRLGVSARSERTVTLATNLKDERARILLALNQALDVENYTES
jgi:hypothetical protein